ncbi:MAG: hypothetical protein AB8G05_08160 [Oligoflexales bacterium]
MRLVYIFVVLLIFQTSCIFSWHEEGILDSVYGPTNTDIGRDLERKLTKKFNLPPDPGWWGKQSLLRVDADNNGLRDDVQRWIYFNYPEEPLIRKALNQEAIDRIETFKLFSDKEKSTIDASNKFMKSMSCKNDIFDMVYFKNEKVPNAIDRKKIDRIIVNTKERFEADLNLNLFQLMKAFKQIGSKES